MVNQKSVVDTYTGKRKKSKHNIKDSHQIAREESKRKRNKKPQKQQNVNKYIPIYNYVNCKWTKYSNQKT